jgi:hypothetical protein
VDIDADGLATMARKLGRRVLAVKRARQRNQKSHLGNKQYPIVSIGWLRFRVEPYHRRMSISGRDFQARLGLAAIAILALSVAQAQAPAGADNAQKLRELIDGYRATQMLYVVAKLRIADHLQHGPLSVKELAQRTSTHEDSLYRLLGTVAGLGVFAEEDGPKFRLTPMAELLRTGVPGSLQVSAEAAGEPWMWNPWGDLARSVQTGEVAFDHLYGKHTWEWFAENPGPAQIFNSLMDELTANETRAVLGGFDFSGARTVVDVGGGRGVLLLAVLGKSASARGILFDLPHVIEAAKKEVPAALAKRIQFTPGDFFKAVPEGGDIYILKNIIHDWADAESGKILDVVRSAMKGHGRMLLVENIVCGPNQICRGKTSDIQMLVRNGGRNRTEKEYRALLGAHGFAITRVVSTAGPSLLEAVSR